MKCHILSKQIQQLAKPLASTFLKKAIKKKSKPKIKSKTPRHKKFSKIETLPQYYGKRVEKDLTSSIPDSFQEGSNFLMVQ